MVKNGYLITRNKEITSDFIFTRTELQETIGNYLSNGTFSNTPVFHTTNQGGLRITAPDENNYLLYLGTDPSTEQYLGVFNKDPQNENMFNFYYDSTKTFYLNLQVVNEPLLSKLLPFIEKTDFTFFVNNDATTFEPFTREVPSTQSSQYFEFTVSIGDTQYRDYSNEPFTVLGNATYKMNIRSIVTETVLDSDLEYNVLWSAGTPIISSDSDENGKYLLITVPDSPTDTPLGNIYRNGSAEPSYIYRSFGNKTAKWYIVDSPIGENGDAYTANQVYSGVFGFLSNTELVTITDVENWAVKYEYDDRHKLIIDLLREANVGAYNSIRIKRNDEIVFDVAALAPIENFVYIDEYGAGNYEVELYPNPGFNFNNGLKHSLVVNAVNIEINIYFNEKNGNLYANENEYLEQMNITPDSGWERIDYKSVIIKESGVYTISLISNNLWYLLIPVPSIFNITAALDTPILNVEMSNQLDLVWDETNSTTYYEIYQDGVLIDSVPSETNNTLMSRSIENKDKKRWIKNV